MQRPFRISFLKIVFFFFAVVLFDRCITTAINETTPHYQVIEQKTPQLFADSALVNNQQNYDIYIFSKGKIYKTIDFRTSGDSIICKTIKLDSVAASKVRKRPLAERTKQVEICVTDSLPLLDTVVAGATIKKDEIIVIRRFKYTEGNSGTNNTSATAEQPTITDKQGNNIDATFNVVLYLLLIGAFLFILFILWSFLPWFI